MDARGPNCRPNFGLAEQQLCDSSTGRRARSMYRFPTRLDHVGARAAHPTKVTPGACQSPSAGQWRCTKDDVAATGNDYRFESSRTPPPPTLARSPNLTAVTCRRACGLANSRKRLAHSISVKHARGHSQPAADRRVLEGDLRVTVTAGTNASPARNAGYGRGRIDVAGVVMARFRTGPWDTEPPVGRADACAPRAGCSTVAKATQALPGALSAGGQGTRASMIEMGVGVSMAPS
jgi:hypothetical protein